MTVDHELTPGWRRVGGLAVAVSAAFMAALGLWLWGF